VLLPFAAKTAGQECLVQDHLCSSATCSQKVYAVWTGTDANGNFLLSQQERPSNFVKSSTGLSAPAP
jgi:hypothetical protein